MEHNKSALRNIIGPSALISLVENWQLNEELTKQLEKEEKYTKFVEWATKNGLVTKGIKFPAAFGPNGVVGLVATEDIPQLTAVAMVPNKILITPGKIAKSECGKMIAEHPDIFKTDESAEFTQLAVFLLQEKIKGEKSFFKPYIDIISPECSTLSSWQDEDIAETEFGLKKEVDEFREEMDRLYLRMKVAFDKYPSIYPPNKYTKEDVCWAYESVMTRCFGWHTPSTMLIPFADSMNHAHDGVTHYMVHRKFEKDDSKRPATYVTKKKKLNLDIFGEKELSLSKKAKQKYFVRFTERQKFIIKHANEGNLPKEFAEKAQKGLLTPEEEKEAVLQVNSKLFGKDGEGQIWDYEFYWTTDDEDNDTEDEEEGESGAVFEKLQSEEEKTQKKNKSEAKTIFSTNESDKISYGQTTVEEAKKDSAKPKNQVPSDDEYSYEEDESEEEEEPNGYSFPADLPRPKMSKYEKMEMNKIVRETKKLNKKPEKNSEKKPEKKPEKKEIVVEPEEESDDMDIEKEGDSESEEEDTNWDWFNDEDDNVYFVITTDEDNRYRKGEQIVKCYGSRSNRFLLMWYGFTMLKNRFNSLHFRLFMNKSITNPDNFDPKYYLYRDYVTGEDWANGKVSHGDLKMKPHDLSREFRIKETRLCEDLLACLRALNMQQYRGADFLDIKVTIPVSIEFETQVIKIALKIFEEIITSSKTTIEEDEKILRENKIIWRYGNKKIAAEQIKLLKMLLAIFESVKTGDSLKKAYLKKQVEFEKDDHEFLCNRNKISRYLKLLSAYVK